MNKFLERFGIFDVFSMLIPGIFFVMGSLYLFPEIISYIPDMLMEGGTKYFLFFATSYFTGVFYHEFGRIWDNVIYGKLLKRKHEEVFLMQEGKVHGKIDQIIFRETRDRICEECMLTENNITKEEKNKNRFTLHFCLSSLEIEGLSGKAEKMLSISEMSRSIYLICTTLLIFYFLFRIHTGEFNCINVFILLLFIVVFAIRNQRYQRFRSDVIMRTYYIYNKKLKKKK